MTHLIEILTALVLSGSIIGAGIKAMAKLTRLVDAVERLSSSAENFGRQLAEQERRIDRLEQHLPGMAGPPALDGTGGPGPALRYHPSPS